MTYYILQQDPRILEQPTILGCPDTIDPLEWIDGKHMTLTDTLLLRMSPRSGAFRGEIIGGLLTLFHKDMKEALTRLGIDNVQYFPVELENPEGEIEINYFLINIIGLFEAVDAQSSVIAPRPSGGRGQLYSFNIDAAAAHGQRLFRIAEAPNLIIIDESLREALLAYNPAGVLMLPTERYDGWSW